MFNLDLLAWLVFLFVVAVASTLVADAVLAGFHVQNVRVLTPLAVRNHVWAMDTLNLHGDAVAWLTDVDLGNGWLVHARLYVHLSLDSVGLAGLWVATHLLGWMLLRIASHLLGWVLLWIASHLLGWILLRVTSHLWLAGLWIAAHLLGWMLLRIASHLLRWVLLWIAAHLWLAGLWVATHLLWWIMLRASNLHSCADLSLGNHAISVNDGYGGVH